MNEIENITIIIVTYKSSHIIKECLESIVNEDIKIIIVDNGSNDNIQDVIKNISVKNCNIDLILLEHNCGFGKANNVALEMVETDFALLLNPDASIDKKSIENLIRCAKMDPKIALASAMDTKNKNPSSQEITNVLELQRKFFTDHSENNDFLEMNFVSGGYMLLKMEVFRKIGFFDNNIFLYGEDDELCSRSLENGYKNILVKSAFVHHKSHQATKTDGIFDELRLLFFRNWHMGWSKTYLKRKNKNYPKVFLKAISRFISIPVYFIKHDRNTAITKISIALGSLSNLIGIDCFNSKNRVPKIKEKVKI